MPSAIPSVSWVKPFRLRQSGRSVPSFGNLVQVLDVNFLDILV
jgi:hypothetical protein